MLYIDQVAFRGNVKLQIDMVRGTILDHICIVPKMPLFIIKRLDYEKIDLEMFGYAKL